MGIKVAALVVACFAFTACEPLYGGKPDHLHPPPVRKKPPEAAEADKPIVYVEECNADFRGDPKKSPPPQTAVAVQLVGNGDAALQNADKAKEDGPKIGLWKEAIDKYRNALIKDPYNIEATLKLAIVYDKVLRKGCALAMLKRLGALSNNTKWQAEANRNIDAIDANAQWFKGYRKDAMAAVGR